MLIQNFTPILHAVSHRDSVLLSGLRSNHKSVQAAAVGGTQVRWYGAGGGSCPTTVPRYVYTVACRELR
eukprot:COSAG02_NODE_2530_length_8601_cov_17.564455_2_plen_69_part_00